MDASPNNLKSNDKDNVMDNAKIYLFVFPSFVSILNKNIRTINLLQILTFSDAYTKQLSISEFNSNKITKVKNIS